MCLWGHLLTVEQDQCSLVHEDTTGVRTWLRTNLCDNCSMGRHTKRQFFWVKEINNNDWADALRPTSWITSKFKRCSLDNWKENDIERSIKSTEWWTKKAPAWHISFVLTAFASDKANRESVYSLKIVRRQKNEVSLAMLYWNDTHSYSYGSRWGLKWTNVSTTVSQAIDCEAKMKRNVRCWALTMKACADGSDGKFKGLLSAMEMIPFDRCLRRGNTW